MVRPTPCPGEHRKLFGLVSSGIFAAKSYPLVSEFALVLAVQLKQLEGHRESVSGADVA